MPEGPLELRSEYSPIEQERGVDAAKLFGQSMPEIAILMLTAHFDAAKEVAKEAGILGVFAKDNVEPLVRRTRATPEMR